MGIIMAKEIISCPNCGKKIKADIVYSVCLDDSPQIKKAIINGKFNCTKCPSCKKVINLTPQVLLTSYSPPRWIWLVSKKHQNPAYPEEFLKTIAPETAQKVVQQEIVFVEFGKPSPALRFILDDVKPKTAEDWTTLGSLFTGNKAIECYQNALRLDNTFTEAKKRLNQELDLLKHYESSY